MEALLWQLLQGLCFLLEFLSVYFRTKSTALITYRIDELEKVQNTITYRTDV